MIKFLYLYVYLFSSTLFFSVSDRCVIDNHFLSELVEEFINTSAL